MTDPVPVEQLSYVDALAELDAILDRLEHDEPDVDVIAADVARASALHAHCRERIRAARMRVDEVVSTLGASEPEDDAGSTSATATGGEAPDGDA